MLILINIININILIINNNDIGIANEVCTVNCRNQKEDMNQKASLHLINDLGIENFENVKQ